MRIIARRRLMELAAQHGDCVEQVQSWYRAARLGPVTDDYLALVRRFPLDSIRDDAHLDVAVAVIDQLVDKETRTEGEDRYLCALSDLIEVYEDAHVSIPDVSGVQLVRYLMEENGLTQQDMAPVFGTQSVASEVLAGKRRLGLSHIRRLAARFGLPADAFID